MNLILQTESIAILLLLVISIVAFAVNRLRIPYTVALVLVGLVLTFRQDLKAEVTPELILALFIPPVAFEAAFKLEWSHLRQDLGHILFLAVVGVIIITIVTGGTVFFLNHDLPFLGAVVFGALISATDPVAVVALFRTTNISRRLSTIIEAESLLNDGTAIVVYNIALVAALSGTFDLLGGGIDFIRVSIGGLAIGGVLGWIVANILPHIDDYLIETTLTTCLAFGSYLLADQFHVSGVLAVVTAGVICGSWGTKGMSPTTKIVVTNFWEYLAFVANSLVFLLIGLAINVSQLANYAGIIAAAIIAVLLSRALVLYIPPLLIKQWRRAVPLSWQHVLLWGGLRGAVSLALALSLPATLENRDTIRVMTFGVVLFTLLVQATTMPFLLRRLKLVQDNPRELERDVQLGRIYAAQAGIRRITQLHDEGLLVGEVWNGLRNQYDAERQQLLQAMQTLYREHSELEREIAITARREALQAERAALNEAVQRGLINHDAFQQLAAEIDKHIDAITLIHDLPDYRELNQPAADEQKQ